MSSRHQPENGADSFDEVNRLGISRAWGVSPQPFDRIVGDASEECPLCLGSGVVMGGDEYHPCPKCAA